MHGFHSIRVIFTLYGLTYKSRPCSSLFLSFFFAPSQLMLLGSKECTLIRISFFRICRSMLKKLWAKSVNTNGVPLVS